MPDRPTIIAHRGFAAVNPENTLAAVRAAEQIADAVEIDVRACADGLVVIHDDTVDRVTEHRGPVSRYSADELETLSVQGSGYGVPRLSTVLNALSADVTAIVDIKEPSTTERVIDVLERTDVDAVLSSFDVDSLRQAKRLAPDLPRSLIADRNSEQALRFALETECWGIHPELSLCLPGPRTAAVAHRWIGRHDSTAAWFGRRGTLERALLGTLGGPSGEGLIRRAQDGGLVANAWTVRTHAQFEALAEHAVDGVALDDPAVAATST